tara:strand:+ start:480 stop:1040 length:561 start_codon:yes stop_codon:yes gene_type:complete
MERGIKNINILNEFCVKFCKILEKHTNYIIVSGFVAIASGRVRATEDIDLIIPKIDKRLFVKIHEDLIENDFVCMQSDNPEEIYNEYLNHKASVRYTLKDQPLPEMELKLSKDELDEYQLKTKQKLKLTGLDLWFSSINMNIAFKEEYLKSDKDLEDAKHLRKVYTDLVSDDEINKIKQMIKRLRL